MKIVLQTNNNNFYKSELIKNHIKFKWPINNIHERLKILQKNNEHITSNKFTISNKIECYLKLHKQYDRLFLKIIIQNPYLKNSHYYKIITYILNDNN